ncbi:hypothetical protein L1887_01474 [Cichorium endivia]|nr:hypothetical protein L1887_01474 [Cichorium endivia]
MSSSTTTFAIFHIISIYLLIVSPQQVASAGRGYKHASVPSSIAIKTVSLEPTVQGFVTQKRPFFHGKEVSGCMPKGRRHSSAPSRYVNNQPLFHSLGCSTVARP